MCIVQGSIERVSGTRIFVAPVDSVKTYDGKERLRQLTIYSNKIAQKSKRHRSHQGGSGFVRWIPGRWTPTEDDSAGSSSSTSDGPTPAMILPAVSFASGSDVIPVDLAGKTDLFEILDSAFPKKMNYALNANDGSRSRGFDTLAVTQVGSYDVSIVPTRDDFSRLSREHFVLDTNVADLFAKRYSKNFAFVVCRLRPGEKFHPIAYVSALSSDKSLFVPTYHYHGHVETVPDWDHEVYAAGGSKAALRKDDLEELQFYSEFTSPERCSTTLKRLQDKLPVLLDFDSIKHLTKTEIKNFSANCDLLFV